MKWLSQSLFFNWQLAPVRVAPERRLQHRLLNGIILGLLALTALAYIAQVMINSYPVISEGLVPVVLSCVLWVAILVINCRGHIQIAGLLLALSITFAIFTLSATATDPDAVYVLYYLVLPVMLSNLFLTFRITVFFYISHLLVMLSVPLFTPYITFIDLPIIFFMLIGGTVLFTRRYIILLESFKQVNENRYQALFEAISDPIIVYENGVLLEVNSAFERMFDIPHGSAVGQDLLNYFAPVGNWNPNRQGITEISAKRSNGSVFFVELHVQSYAKRQRRLQVATLRDLTERKIAEDRTQALMLEQERVRLMKRFISDISHDLRTPLTVIMTGLYMLKITPDREQQMQRIELLENHIQNLGSMLENLLTVARLEQVANNVFDFQMADLNQVVQSCVAEQQFIAADKAIKIHFIPDATLPRLPLDSREMQQAVRQLFTNAIHYTPSGGRIEARTCQVDGSAIFEIKDTGVGIPPDKLNHIFELFYRADEARGMDTGGMGMGLTICQRIVQGHDGKIEVESQPGIGTTFRIFLPVKTLSAVGAASAV